MAEAKKDVARFNPETGIAEVRHGEYGWHWACARHRGVEFDENAHLAAGKTYAGENKAEFLKALNREDGFVSKIAEVNKAYQARQEKAKAEREAAKAAETAEESEEEETETAEATA